MAASDKMAASDPLVLLDRLMKSDSQDSLKMIWAEKLIAESVKQTLSKEKCLATFNELSVLVLTSDKDYIKKSALHAFQNLINTEGNSFLEFLSTAYIVQLFSNPIYTNKINLIGLVMTMLSNFSKLNTDTDRTEQIYRVLRAQISMYLRAHGSDISIAAGIGYLYTSYPLCIPTGLVDQCRLSVSIVNLLAGYNNPTPNKLISFRKSIDVISKMITVIYEKSATEMSEGNEQIWLEVLKQTYSFVSSSGEKEDMDALCFLIESVPTPLMNTATKTILDESDNISGETGLVKALSRLINYMCIWPSPRISIWVQQILRDVKKDSILCSVGEETIVKLLRSLETPIHRGQTGDIFFTLLYGYQHSPTLFHKVVTQIPGVLNKLSNTRDISARDSRDKLVEATKYLIELFPGYPDLYTPLANTVSSTSISSQRKEFLSGKSWSSGSIIQHSSILSNTSSSHFVGLLNLENTCYMNAVIQALFMAKQFRLTLLGLSSLSGQPALRSLQSLLAFLTYSHRNLYTPREFQRTANPPWFTPGRQHDCSEFMSYLMDICHEEQRSSFALSNSMKQNAINKELGSITELPEVVSEPTSQVEDWNMAGGSMSSLCAEVDSQDDLNLIGTSRDELDLIGNSRDNLDRVGDSRDNLDRMGDSRDNLDRMGDSQDNLDRIEDSSFDQMMGSTENLESDRFDENIEDVPEAAEDCVEDENEVEDVVGELRGSRDDILVSSSRENINTSRENLISSRSNLDISRENLNTSRSSLADEDRLSRVGSRGSLGMSRWCTEENLSSSSGSREVLNVSGSREVLNLSFNDSRSALNIPDLDARQGVNKKRIVDEKSEDGHSNSTDSGIQSVEESSHGSQDKLSDHAAESVKEKEKARPEIQTIIENFFGGRLQITVRCHSCSKDSIREDYFTHLGLSFPGKDESDEQKKSEKSNLVPGSKDQPETEISENSTQGETKISENSAQGETKISENSTQGETEISENSAQGETETSLNCDIKQSDLASATAEQTCPRSIDTNSKQSLTLAMVESTSSTLANNEANLANKDSNLAANEETNKNLNLSEANSTEPGTNLLVSKPTPSSNLSSESKPDIKISPPDTTTLSNSILSGVKPNLAYKPGVINPMQSDLTLDNLIQKYLEPELLSGCNQYYCESCDKKTDATQSFSIISSPFYLNITLNRFEYDRVLERKKKIFTKIEYPRHITLNTTLHNQTELVSYRLQSIIVHSGYSSDSGHYYTWSRDTEDESLWHIFNDSMVTSSTWNNFIQQTERLSRDTPYILMYEREDIENKLEAVIPPPSLMEVVQRDNIRYAQEKRGNYSTGQDRFRPVNKDEEDDPGPGPSCAENFGQLGGGRFIF